MCELTQARRQTGHANEGSFLELLSSDTMIDEILAD